MIKERGVSPELLTVITYLKKNVSCLDAISIERRVEVFEGKKAVEALLTSHYKTNAPKGSPVISNPETAKLFLKRLIAAGLLIRATVKGTKNVPLSLMQQAAVNANAASPSSSPPLPPPAKILIVEPDPVISWADDAYYIMIYEGSKFLQYSLSFGLLIFTFVMVMYPLWPSSIRHASWYVAMTGMSLIGSLLGLAVIRLILFLISKPFTSGFWLFPNLFEDVGFFDSFKPLYGWDAPSNAVVRSPHSQTKESSSHIALGEKMD